MHSYVHSSPLSERLDAGQLMRRIRPLSLIAVDLRKRSFPMRQFVSHFATVVGLAALCVASSGCSKQPQAEGAPAQQPATGMPGMAARPPQTAAEVTKAICVVHPLGGSKVMGKVTFAKHAEGVEITAEISGLTPGDHGFHVHEWGDCSAADGASAGSHYNPSGVPHGRPDAAERHMGDFGNLTAAADGTVKYSRVDKVMMLNGPNSIIGRSIIIHANPDDFSQPVGNAGGRIACGVIGIAKPE
jgi:Cu-Zn family superoxide dismutase